MTNNLTTIQPVNHCVLEPLSVVLTQVPSVVGASVLNAAPSRAVNNSGAIVDYPTVTNYPTLNDVPAVSTVPTWRTRGITATADATNGMTADRQPAASAAASFAGSIGAAPVRFEAAGGAKALGSASAASAPKQAHAQAMKSTQSAFSAAKRGAPPRRIPDPIP